MLFGGATIVDHPTAGPSLRCNQMIDGKIVIVPIPADRLAEVRAYIDGYRAEVLRRFEAASADREAYERTYDAIEHMRVHGYAPKGRGRR